MLAGMHSPSKKREVSVLFFPSVTIKYNNEYIQRTEITQQTIYTEFHDSNITHDRKVVTET
jgi:hypothetical protein